VSRTVEPKVPGAAEAGALRIAVRGSIERLEPSARARLLDRRQAEDPCVAEDVRRIVEDVRKRGDGALRDMARFFDAVELEQLEVQRDRWEAARATLDPAVREALQRAARNIYLFHRAAPPSTIECQSEPGVVLQRRYAPVERAGVYAPGGTAAYPSSVLMGALAARAAGVPEVIVCSPPGPDGSPSAEVLAAAAIAKADRLFAVGGAGAIAAMAFGTATIPRCAAVVGPGNRWVIEAKRQVAGDVLIDAPAGPSELLVIADADASSELIAAELLAQAEHDPDAAVALVTTSEALLGAVAAELERQSVRAPRRKLIAESLAARGALLLARDIDEAIGFANEYAPEHLAIYTRDAERYAERIRWAGTVFVGEASSVVFGDYMTGANHVLPTAGAARSHSGLSALTFLRSWTVQTLSDEAAAQLAPATRALALAEGLPAHAAAATLRERKPTRETDR
jgi:histidinol dehydrogenase